MKVVVLGAGNMGSVFAGRLAHSGHEVTLIARNARLRELQQNGLRLRNRLRRRLETYRLPAEPKLTPETPADAILVMVQRPQIDELIPSLISHPCQRICFLFNCSEIDPAWQAALGDRLVWGFPSALGGTKDGIVNYVLLPRYLRFLQVTTVGVDRSGSADTAREIVGLLNQSGIATVFHPDMRSWLMSHTALMLPGMAVGERKFRSGERQTMSFRESRAVAKAQKECFAVSRAVGASITPLNMKFVSIVPSVVVACTFWLLSRTTPYGRSMTDHVDHGRGEMMTMYAGIRSQADQHSVSTEALDELCEELMEPVA
ncbi:MAG: NAD-binding protein [Actinobacteria bacterium]|nr:NAD-binding protein [Actinomycetota bacterium]